MKVITFGEVLLRLATPGFTKLFQKDSFDTSFCGAEANVAVSLSYFGADSVFVTKLPDSDVGLAATHSMDYFKVDTSKIQYGEGRLGLYYIEKGVSQRPSKVIYDRAYSSFALSRKEEYDWNNIFAGGDWFHWTGINPALSDELVLVCEEACRIAKKKGLTISCDLNYRSKLWSSEKAQRIMKPLLQYVDVCICNEEDAEKVLGIKPRETNIESGVLNDSDFIHTAEEICNTYGCKYVAITLRKSLSASRNGWRAMLYDSETTKSYFSRDYEIEIVDRVGGGDSFGAGLIFAMGQGMEPRDIIEFATAASCLKQTIEGDFNRASVKEVEELVNSTGSGRIQR